MGWSTAGGMLVHNSVVHIMPPQLAQSTALAFGCTAEVDWLEEEHPHYPPTVNDPTATTFATRTVDKYVVVDDTQGALVIDLLFSCFRLFGDGTVQEIEPTMGAEDFSFITRAVPSCMVFLGMHNETAGSVHKLHTPRYAHMAGAAQTCGYVVCHVVAQVYV